MGIRGLMDIQDKRTIQEYGLIHNLIHLLPSRWNQDPIQQPLPPKSLNSYTTVHEPFLHPFIPISQPLLSLPPPTPTTPIVKPSSWPLSTMENLSLTVNATFAPTLLNFLRPVKPMSSRAIPAEPKSSI
mmetsp:Transcript_29617/g.61500  ORF Transcript_29617/g.61500 Transcript_29617/m.61500 type:complete len:129 (-) Transcript_29617:1386-1772(-)